MEGQIASWLASFELDDRLRLHAQVVLSGMPAEVRQDLMGELAVIMCEVEWGLGRVAQIPVPSPSARGAGRAVVFKTSLQGRPTSFVRWVIAHELAHAYLRNAGRFPGEDPELAADALAAQWGFPKPV